MKYLIRSSIGNGYVFPEEDDLSDPSQASFACFAFLESSKSITIRAIDEGEARDFPLMKVGDNDSLLYADTGYGVVYFRVKRGLKYIGKKMPQSVKLNWLDPLNVYELERLCFEHQFFFVGDTDV